jgi:hypothetical protein
MRKKNAKVISFNSYYLRKKRREQASKYCPLLVALGVFVFLMLIIELF